MTTKNKRISVLLLALLSLLNGCTSKEPVNNYSKKEALEILTKVNDRWQELHPEPASAFWHASVYHTGNLAAYEVTENLTYKFYSTQ